MKLLRFAYKEKDWELKEVNFQSVNLLVGKNASGKSKTIQSMNVVVAYLLQQKEISSSDGFDFFLYFEKGEEFISYRVKCADGVILFEEIKVQKEGQDEILLQRNKEITTLHGMAINPPNNKLTPHVRRDTVSYPYIEAIMQWAEHVCGQRFNETDIWGDSLTGSYIQAHGKNLYTMTKTLPDDRIEYIKELANQLDYPLTDIRLFESKDIHKILFYEKGVNHVLLDSDLSKGMFRTLHLIIYLEYLIQQDCPSLLLIDDVCEGLDYNRSTQLGKYLFQRCEEQDIQLIASSNDSFLMDVVDTRYWNILFRQGSEVSSINYLTHPQLFDEFVYTGLSNFDLFSSDYIDRYLLNHE